MYTADSRRRHAAEIFCGLPVHVRGSSESSRLQVLFLKTVLLVARSFWSTKGEVACLLSEWQ